MIEARPKNWKQLFLLDYHRSNNRRSCHYNPQELDFYMDKYHVCKRSLYNAL
jgi:hypothetical protein